MQKITNYITSLFDFMSLIDLRIDLNDLVDTMEEELEQLLNNATAEKKTN